MLDPATRDRLRARYQQLAVEGKIVTIDQLGRYYATFRARFGTDRLAVLDGEPLLEAMHAQGGRDSLMYWLEFKNDDEFPNLFGSIAGGSALKYGVFQRKETGAWETGDGNGRSKEIPIAEAVAIARRQRNQLVRGDGHRDEERSAGESAVPQPLLPDPRHVRVEDRPALTAPGAEPVILKFIAGGT